MSRTHALLFLILTALLSGPMMRAHALWTDTYDESFQKWSEHYFGKDFDWRIFKAQAIVESGLKPDARSHAGARGLMQIMPATMRELRRANPGLFQVDGPETHIAAGICYDRLMWELWPKVADEDRIALMLAAYHAGPGRVGRAAAKRQDWESVRRRLPAATRRYVAAVRPISSSQRASPRL